MLLLLGEAVSLVPDKTLLPQLLIFFAAAFVLSIFVFRPVLKIIDERRKRTFGLNIQADELAVKSNQLLDKYNEVISAAKREGEIEQEKIIKVGQGEAKKIIVSAKQVANEAKKKQEDVIIKEADLIRSELGKKREDLAKLIVSKVLDNSNNNAS